MPTENTLPLTLIGGPADGTVHHVAATFLETERVYRVAHPRPLTSIMDEESQTGPAIPITQYRITAIVTANERYYLGLADGIDFADAMRKLLGWYARKHECICDLSDEE